MSHLIGSLELPKSSRFRVRTPISFTSVAARLPPLSICEMASKVYVVLDVYKESMLKKLLQRAHSNYRLLIALLLVVCLLLGVVYLSEKASRQSDARKSPEALQF